MRNLILVATLAAMALSCSQKKPAAEEPFDAALPPNFDAGPLGALYLLTIWPPSERLPGATVSCTEGFCSDRATHVNSGPGGMQLAINPAGLTMVFDTRAGSTVTFDGHETKITQARQQVSFPHMLERVSNMPVREHSLEVDVKVVTPGMKSEAAKSKLDMGYVRWTLDKVKDRPVLFPGETKETPNAKKVAFMSNEGHDDPIVIGNPNARWRDIDLVGTVEHKSEPGDACPVPKGHLEGIGTNHGLGLGTRPFVPHVQKLHSDVTLYDRRTGREFDRHSFDSVGKCQAEPLDAGPDASGLLNLGMISSGPTTPNNDAAIEAWIRSKLAP